MTLFTRIYIYRPFEQFCLLSIFWQILKNYRRHYNKDLSPTAWLNRFFHFQLDFTHKSILQSPQTSDFLRSLLRCSFQIHLFQKLIYFWLVHKKNIWFWKCWFGHAYLRGNRSLFIPRQSFIFQQLIYFEISINDKQNFFFLFKLNLNAHMHIQHICSK